jgi:hypothetical protein
MKAQADKHRQERTFAVGDWVYMKLQPYAQMSIHRRSNHKLSYRFFGPFLVLQRVGKVAYKLQLPESSKIHPVVHVSQLKKAIPLGAQVSSDGELNVISTLSTLVHAQVLDTCLHKVGNKAVQYGLVQWDHLLKTWATSENMKTIPRVMAHILACYILM